MTAIFVANEGALRLSAFLGLSSLLALAEVYWPRRALSQSRSARWPANIVLVVIDTAVLRFAFPLLAVATALWAEDAGVGLLNALAAPAWLAFPVAFLVLDLTVYGQHVLFHRVALFWRFHRIHHADRDVDVTTAVRFHPVEIAASMLLKMAVVALLGAPALAVVLFEIALNAGALFSHANIKLSPRLDRALRRVLVTPDMHRVHHSVNRDEHDRNFGFLLSWWDRLFSTYRPQPALGHEAMALGQTRVEPKDASRLAWLLAAPFARAPR